MVFCHAYEIEAPVDPVGTVNIDGSRCTEHNGIAVGFAAKAVGSRIGLVVCLGLDNDAAGTAIQEKGTDQLLRDDIRGIFEIDSAVQTSHMDK